MHPTDQMSTIQEVSSSFRVTNGLVLTGRALMRYVSVGAVANNDELT